MITTKQRANLRRMANKMDTILQIGKDGIGENTIVQVNDALLAREMIKMRVLETSPVSAREAAQELASICDAAIVQVIGTRFVLYKPHPKDPKIKI